MNFCSNCGSAVESAVPPGDDRPRFVCPACGMIHYQNPKLVVGCIPVWKTRVLLCQRAIKPCYGLWTLPAGYLENGESVAEGAIREAREEARASLSDLEPYALYNICHINQVYLFFRAKLLDLKFRPGRESQEVRLFEQSEIPWDKIAFRAVELTLRRYFKDRISGHFPFHTADIKRKLPNLH